MPLLQEVIVETDRLEKEMEAGTTIRDCFRRVNIRRTEISVGVYAVQVLSGIYLIGYSNYFFTRTLPHPFLVQSSPAIEG
jgi:hypothetical protein